SGYRPLDGIFHEREDSKRQSIYLPVVITTADIYLAEFEPQEAASGIIPPGRLALGGPKQWISYEFPLPDYLGYEIRREDNSASVKKRTIFIVNESSLEDFLVGALSVSKLDEIPSPPPSRMTGKTSSESPASS
ncbi:hypothetical protein, partial [Frankia sp. AgB1.8]|uniref:hypothetical protein n=1 Tax=Frankia sp. AgB1.8 TaxID=2792839 RepID=UPI001EE3D196